MAKQCSKPLQHPDGADGAVKPSGVLLEQAGLGASPQRDVPSHSTITFVIWKVRSILCSDCAVHESARFRLASVMHQEPPYGELGNEKNAKLPPERQMASEAPANGSTHGNEVNHLFLSNVNQADQYEHFIQGS